jgi:hypothetical protein
MSTAPAMMVANLVALRHGGLRRFMAARGKLLGVRVMSSITVAHQSPTRLIHGGMNKKGQLGLQFSYAHPTDDGRNLKPFQILTHGRRTNPKTGFGRKHEGFVTCFNIS